jgi:hypothetical protein
MREQSMLLWWVLFAAGVVVIFLAGWGFILWLGGWLGRPK